VDIERLEYDDADAVRGCHSVHLAAQRADDPQGTWLSAAPFLAWLSVGWEGDPREVWLTRGADRGVTGWYRLELPDRENLDRGALERSSAWEGSAGEAFARWTGASATLSDIRRVQELAELPVGQIGELRRVAGQAAAGYALTSWTGLVPERFLDGVAAVNSAMADAPSPAGFERREWDAARVRTEVNGIFPRLGLRQHSVAAVADASGAMAALTQVWIDPAIPDWGFQGLTAVVREHRGHRLGLLVKAAMLDVVAQAEPQVKRLETWNAATNAHMIAVNEALGYQVHGPPNVEWELDLPAEA